MALSKDYAFYGPEYEQLLLRVHEGLQTKAEFAVQFAEGRVAHSIQARTRAYFRALQASSDRPDLVAMCSNLSSRLAGSALVFYRREDAPDAMALRDALGLTKGFADGVDTRGVLAPDSSLSSHLDKLKEIRKRK